MSIFAVASLRPLQRHCLHRANIGTGLLSVRLGSPSSSFRLRAIIVTLPPNRQRYQSTSSQEEAQNEPPPPPPSPSEMKKLPKISFRQFVGRALSAGLRNLTFAFSLDGIRHAYRQYPISTSYAVILLLVIGVLSGIVLTRFFYTFYNDIFCKYPQPLAGTLRRAIYYSNYNPDPERALKYWKRAMQECAEVGLDPFSDEALGIRIQVAGWLQSIGNHKNSVTVLESVLFDCLKWITDMEQSVLDGQVDKDGFYISSPNPPSDNKATLANIGNETENSTVAVTDQESATPRETLWKKRERLLSKAVRTSVTLGELCADEHVQELEKATERLQWAVSTALREFDRRQTQGNKPGEEAWLSPAEVGGALESLAHDLERRSKFHIAIPVFAQALRLCELPCHGAIIMNNVAVTLAQVPASLISSWLSDALASVGVRDVPKTKSECLVVAENWARSAIIRASAVEGEKRTAECDEACAAALCTWGDVAALRGDVDLAKRKYEQCIEMSTELGYPDTARQAMEGLAVLKKKKSI